MNKIVEEKLMNTQYSLHYVKKMAAWQMVWFGLLGFIAYQPL